MQQLIIIEFRKFSSNGKKCDLRVGFASNGTLADVGDSGSDVGKIDDVMKTITFPE